MTLKIKKTHLNEIFKEARRKYLQSMILIGKISGNERVVEKVYHAKNVLSSTPPIK